MKFLEFLLDWKIATLLILELIAITGFIYYSTMASRDFKEAQRMQKKLQLAIMNHEQDKLLNLAEKVKEMRNYQNGFFRIHRDNKDARQTALRISKEKEKVVDDLVKQILEPKLF